MCSSVLQLAGGCVVAPPVGSREDNLPGSHTGWVGLSSPSSSQTAGRIATGRGPASRSGSRLLSGAGSHHDTRILARTHRQPRISTSAT